ncbi:MAG: signal peptide peptidase SppA [Myxococcales bacterium]|nr:signal peptide peptidase SppA [Myxococcales bacterium]
MIRLLFAPLSILLWVLLSPLRALRRARAAPKGALLEANLQGHVLEGPLRPERWSFFARRRASAPTSLVAVRRLVDLALCDPRVAGLLVRVEHFTAGWATAAALRAELARLRAAGKRTVAYLPEGGGNVEMLVATGCETLIAPPVVDIAPVGPRATGVFLHDLLDQAGVDVELLARKEFKSAGDRLARQSRSEPDRLQTEALIGAFDGALVAAIAEGRQLTVEEAKAARDLGPTRAKVAVERKLLDRVAHDDELPAALGDPKLGSAARYLRAKRSHPFPVRFRRRVIGVVQVHGTITDDAPMVGGFGRMAVAKQVVADLRAATLDPRVAGVVLDIDSPGGTVTGSDAIFAAVRRLAKDKPVVARMGDVAASGGYYVAMAARTVIAHPLTITGSIGVVSLRPVLARLAARFGVARDAIHLGRFADLESLLRAPTDEERALLDREIDGHYAEFVELVAASRKRPLEEIEPLCRGRVYTGEAAHGLGLVDALGGFTDAVARVRAEVGPVDDEPVVIVGKHPSPRPPTPKVAALLPELPGFSALVPWLAMLESRARVVALEPFDVR